eukprot:4513530-Pyramimonas_sp.AAC.1
MRYPDINFEAYFIRPTNGHSSPGIKCPELLYTLYTYELRTCPLLGHSVISLVEFNGRTCRAFSVLDYHAAPTTPSRRGAD